MIAKIAQVVTLYNVSTSITTIPFWIPLTFQAHKCIHFKHELR